MANKYDPELDERGSRRRVVQSDAAHRRGPEADRPHHDEHEYASSVLRGRAGSKRGEGPVRTAFLQNMQQTHGNRAVQRFIQRASGSAAPQVEEDLASKIQSKSGSGHGLDKGVRSELESGLGSDMSGVRVHTDSEADHMARSVDAVAFTTGSDIFFRQGAYNPGSSAGMQLLAHEATHTVQQSRGPVAGTPVGGGVAISDPSDSYEQEADKNARQVASGSSAGPGSAALPAVQRRAAQEEEAVQRMRSSNLAMFLQREDEGKASTDGKSGTGAGGKDGSTATAPTVKGMTAKSEEEQKTLEQFHESLDESEKQCEHMVLLQGEEEVREKYEDAAEKFRLLAKAMTVDMEVKAESPNVSNFILAVKELKEMEFEKLKPEDIDKEKLVDAFEKVFEMAGKLIEDVSSDGGWREHLRELGLLKEFLEEQKTKETATPPAS